MKKYIHLTLLCLGLSFSSRAQYVYLPDQLFVTFLNNNGFSSCLNGSMLDTTCPAVLNATGIYCDNLGISDITGIQYFKNLDTLECAFNYINTLPALPPALQFFDCSSDYIDTLPPLPSTLTALYCSDDNIKTLPALPAGLTFLQSDYSQLSSLPVLPAGLQHLECLGDSLSSVPALPASLNYLDVSYNPYITSLPALPAELNTLNCNNCSITAIPALNAGLMQLNCSYNLIPGAFPALPDSLQNFNCGSNAITSLPALNSLLASLDCSYNPLYTLPALPAGMDGGVECSYDSLSVLPAIPVNLQIIDCSGNHLTNLPVLPSGLTQITCTGNYFDTLPPLPPYLQILWCGDSNLTVVPSLPSTMLNLFVENSPLITSLPALPRGLYGLHVSNNNLLSLPVLTDTLYTLDCSHNPNLTCLPQLKYIENLDFSYTGVTCLPDYGNVTTSNPALNTVPLCGIFNPGSCGVFWNISGEAFYDAIGNCTFSAPDVQSPNIKVQLISNDSVVQQVYTDTNGLYSFLTSTYGTYTTHADTTGLPFTALCPTGDSYTQVIALNDTLYYDDNFAFTCKPGFDVGVNSIAIWQNRPRPGAIMTLHTVAGDLSQLYGAHCAAGISGQIQMVYNGSMKYVGNWPGSLPPSMVTGNTLTWNIADFGAAGLNVFNPLFQVDSISVAGTQLCWTVNVTPVTGDYNPSNNMLSYCATLVDAQDPNEKDVYPTEVSEAGGWLTYTVHFQNTGNAPAVNILVTDTLDSLLDASTFQLLSYSNKNLTQLFGNIVNFSFANINLPDSISDPAGSQGYVQFRIKARSGLTLGSIIKNTASVYFDLNNPIVTNSANDTVVSCVPGSTLLSRVVCPGDTAYFNGHAYTQSGSYAETLNNVGGCDSVVTLYLTASPVTYNSLSHAMCQGDTFYVGNIIHTQGGNYSDTIGNLEGCDSVVSLALTVNPLPAVSLNWDSLDVPVGQFSSQYYLYFGNVFCTAGSPASFTLMGGTPAGGYYSGVGVDNNVFYGDSLYNLGHYNDTITYSYTNASECSANASDIITIQNCEGIKSIPATNLFTLYPNPADDYTMIDFDPAYGGAGATITVKDITGREVFETRLTSSPQQLPTGNLTPGVYLVTMYYNGQAGARLLVKE